MKFHPRTKLRVAAHRIHQRYLQASSKLCPSPIFVYGHQKSGTTAIAALLASATKLSYTSDPFYQSFKHDTHRYLLEEIVNGHLSTQKFINRHRLYFSRDIIKDPDFIFFCEKIWPIFPNSRHVFIIRDPRQNIRSILDRLEIPGHLDSLPPTTINRVQNECPIWEPILKGKPLALDSENHIECLAHRWNFSAKTYLRHKAKFDLIRYEDFKSDQTQTIGKLADCLGLNVVRDIKQQATQQYQPKGKHHDEVNDFLGKKNIKTIIDICAPTMSKFRYE